LYKGNETFCSFKIVVCQKGTYLFNSVITVGKLNTELNRYVPFWQTTILNEQNVSFPLYKCIYNGKSVISIPQCIMGKIEIKITN
jgi:hypothetical protein